MKIGSTEASGMNYNISNTSGNQEFKPVTKENKEVSQNLIPVKKDLSRLSDFEKKELAISDKVVVDAIDKANKAVSGLRKFEFAIHEKTKEVMIKVIDSDTNEVIREIPPEKVLDMVAKMWEMAGLVVDERR